MGGRKGKRVEIRLLLFMLARAEEEDVADKESVHLGRYSIPLGLRYTRHIQARQSKLGSRRRTAYDHFEFAVASSLVEQ